MAMRGLFDECGICDIDLLWRAETNVGVASATNLQMHAFKESIFSPFPRSLLFPSTTYTVFSSVQLPRSLRLICSSSVTYY